MISGAGKSLNRRKENSGEKKKKRTQRLGLVQIGQLLSQDLFPNLNLGFFFLPNHRAARLRAVSCFPSRKIHRLGARKPSAQTQSGKTRSRIVFRYTEGTLRSVARQMLAKDLLEEKCSNHSTKCKGDRSAYYILTKVAANTLDLWCRNIIILK